VANAEGLVSLLAVPLSVRDRTIGVLSCFMAVRHDFGAKEVDVLSMLGNQAALAIENARLALSAAVVREMHHRVKNNLQTVAMLLRLQMGGADDERIRGILTDAVSRVLNIAAVHETLSESGLRMVDIREVLGRIARNMAELAPGRNVEMQVEGDLLHLPSRSATSLALVVGELVQNAMKHAFQGREHGRITIQLTAGDLEHQVAVFDDGVGNSAPRSTRRGLGMDIIQTLVSDDLKGQFETQSTADGTRAWVRFPVVTDEGALS
jgi:two-component sensor histidine kinase